MTDPDDLSPPAPIVPPLPGKVRFAVVHQKDYMLGPERCPGQELEPGVYSGCVAEETGGRDCMVCGPRSPCPVCHVPELDVVLEQHGRCYGCGPQRCHEITLTTEELRLVVRGLDVVVSDYEGPWDVEAERALSKRLEALLPEEAPGLDAALARVRSLVPEEET